MIVLQSDRASAAFSGVEESLETAEHEESLFVCVSKGHVLFLYAGVGLFRAREHIQRRQ